MKSVVNISNLYELNDWEMMKIIFSSGDYFPGFYRYTLGTQKVGDESLGLSTLIWLYYEQDITGKLHHKESWLDLHHEVHDREVASEKARNAGNFPKVRKLFADAMMDWYFESKGFDIAYMDIFSKVKEFKAETTYYFMGSLINYSSGALNVGFNRLTGDSVLKLNVEFAEMQNYLQSIFTDQQMSDLFLEADIVANLSYNTENFGVLNFSHVSIDDLLLKHPEIKVFAAPIESRNLPMRYAKCIRLTNFRRGEEGTFEPWKSDQNW